MDIFFVYTTKASPRIDYIFDLIFRRILGVKQLEITQDLHCFTQKNNVAKINYSPRFMVDIPFFRPHGLLEQTDIQYIRPSFALHKGLAASFYAEDTKDNTKLANSLLPFDPFALCFYLVSRYEEYLDFKEDKHGRFSATSSLAYQYNFLEQPLVNLWALEIKKLILSYYPRFQFRSTSYQFQPTLDIDHAYAFLKKGWWRQTGAFFRNLKNKDTESLSLQLKTGLRLQQDPYFCFDYISHIHQQYSLNPIFFWLIGDYGTYDKNISHNNKYFRQLVHLHAQQYPCGIHPSYRSNQSQDLLDKEIHRLEKITKLRTFRSRQHFLKLKLPTSYRRLINLGIQQDYSMGYASQPGFRASIAQSFPWFDLEQNKVQGLEIIPFQLMDVTLNTYLELTPDKAIESAIKIIKTTRNVNGHLVSIWHNSSLCEAWQWKGWRRVYEALLAEATKTS